MTMHSALFLDRDGVLIEDKHYLEAPDAVQLIPGAREALVQAIELGARLFLLTNQSGVGKGYFPIASVHACNERMLALLDLPEPGFTGIKVAPETPYQAQLYRKPSPRFIVEMIADHDLDPELCVMMGDRYTDLQAGWNAGIHAVAVQTGQFLDSQTMALIARRGGGVFASLARWMQVEGKKRLAAFKAD